MGIEDRVKFSCFKTRTFCSLPGSNRLIISSFMDMKSGSALNTRFKRCFSHPYCYQCSVPEPGRPTHGLVAAKCYRIHVRSFLHRFPYGCLIPCLRSKVSVSERRRLMQERLRIAGGDTLIRPSYIQTAF